MITREQAERLPYSGKPVNRPNNRNHMERLEKIKVDDGSDDYPNDIDRTYKGQSAFNFQHGDKRTI